MKLAEQEEAQVEPVEQKQLKARTKQYSNKKTSINKLRDL